MPGPALGAEQIPDLSRRLGSPPGSGSSGPTTGCPGSTRSTTRTASFRSGPRIPTIRPATTSTPPTHGSGRSRPSARTSSSPSRAPFPPTSVPHATWPSTSTSWRTSSDTTSDGWGGGGFANAVTRWEFGDQPDFGTLHFDGTPDEFYEMYAAAARAVKRVEPAAAVRWTMPGVRAGRGTLPRGVPRLRQARTSCPWTSSRGCGSPTTLATRSTFGPWQRNFAASWTPHGFETTELLLAYWNMTGIPNAQFADADAAAFQAAAAVYMQDSAIDRAILFRADTGTDLHYNITRPRRHLRAERQRERQDGQLSTRRTNPLDKRTPPRQRRR